jgi:aryl-alcohol dehydrogenase-like predicted oxidoreductase
MSEISTAPKVLAIGNDDPVVNRIGYGAMQLTGEKVWGEYPDRDGGIALLRAAVDSGVTFIDTADVYGPHSNEILIHDALHPYPDDLVLATKGGFVRGGPEYTDMDAVGNRLYLRQCAYTSARRLGVEQIDLYYLHSPTATDVPFEEQVATLAKLQEEGLIRHVGLSNVSAEQFRLARGIVEIAAVTAHYNIGVRVNAELLGAAEEAGVIFSPWHPAVVPTGCEAPLSAIARKYDASVHQIALAWQLHRSPLTIPIPGTTHFAHVEENLAAGAITLTPEEVDTMTQLVPESTASSDQVDTLEKRLG